MRFVSTFSATQGMRGGLRITELQVVNSRRGRRVLMNQAPYLGPRSTVPLVLEQYSDPETGRPRLRFRPIVPRATSLLIVDELEDCRFTYLQPADFRNRESAWLPVWTDAMTLPEAVAIHVAPKQGEARLRPVSIFAPILSLGIERSSGRGSAPPPGTVPLRGSPQ
jgi:hypothetical protein